MGKQQLSKSVERVEALFHKGILTFTEGYKELPGNAKRNSSIIQVIGFYVLQNTGNQFLNFQKSLLDSFIEEGVLTVERHNPLLNKIDHVEQSKERLCFHNLLLLLALRRSLRIP